MAKASTGEVREGLHPVNGYRHFGQHAHDQQDDEPRNGKGEDGGGASLADRGGRTNEQPGANNAANRDHRDMARLQTARQFRPARDFGRHFMCNICHTLPPPYSSHQRRPLPIAPVVLTLQTI